MTFARNTPANRDHDVAGTVNMPAADTSPRRMLSRYKHASYRSLFECHEKRRYSRRNRCCTGNRRQQVPPRPIVSPGDYHIGRRSRVSAAEQSARDIPGRGLPPPLSFTRPRGRHEADIDCVSRYAVTPLFLPVCVAFTIDAGRSRSPPAPVSRHIGDNYHQ